MNKLTLNSDFTRSRLKIMKRSVILSLHRVLKLRFRLGLILGLRRILRLRLSSVVIVLFSLGGAFLEETTVEGAQIRRITDENTGADTAPSVNTGINTGISTGAEIITSAGSFLENGRNTASLLPSVSKLSSEACASCVMDSARYIFVAENLPKRFFMDLRRELLLSRRQNIIVFPNLPSYEQVLLLCSSRYHEKESTAVNLARAQVTMVESSLGVQDSMSHASLCHITINPRLFMQLHIKNIPYYYPENEMVYSQTGLPWKGLYPLPPTLAQSIALKTQGLISRLKQRSFELRMEPFSSYRYNVGGGYKEVVNGNNK